MKTGIELIAEERERQVSVEGWTPEHDAEHVEGELAAAGASYAHHHALRMQNALFHEAWTPGMWPWDREWWKPNSNPIHNLAKAGALIAAEIDRLNRKAEHMSIPPAAGTNTATDNLRSNNFELEVESSAPAQEVKRCEHQHLEWADALDGLRQRCKDCGEAFALVVATSPASAREWWEGNDWNPAAHIYAVCEHCGKKIYHASQRGADWNWYHCFNYAKHCNYDIRVREQRGHVAEPNIIQLSVLKAYTSTQGSASNKCACSLCNSGGSGCGVVKASAAPPYSKIDAAITKAFEWPWPPNAQRLYAEICDLFDGGSGAR